MYTQLLLRQQAKLAEKCNNGSISQQQHFASKLSSQYINYKIRKVKNKQIKLCHKGDFQLLYFPKRSVALHVYRNCCLYCLHVLSLAIQKQVTVDNVDMIIEKLANIVTEVSHPADQSSENLEVITTVFSRAASLIASGNISVSRTVSTNIPPAY